MTFGGRERIFSNDGKCLSTDYAWKHGYCSSCRRGAKDCCLYGKCCFFDHLRQVRKQLGELWSPCFSYFLDCVLKLKDAQDVAAVARKEARHGSYTMGSPSYRKHLDGADISKTSYLATGEWRDIGRESDCGTTYLIFGSVFDMHNMRMGNSQAVTKSHFLAVLSNLKGGTMCFHIQGREVVCLYLLHVSSSCLSNHHLLQSSCLQMPSYGDEVILNSAFLDMKCYSFGHYPKGNRIHHSKEILKDDCFYQQMRVLKRSNGGSGAEFCRPTKKTCISHGNVAFKVNAGIDSHVIGEEEKDDLVPHSQSNMQLWWTKSKNSSEHLLMKQKEDRLVVEKSSGSASVNVTNHESLESSDNSSKKLQHGLDTQKCQGKSSYLFDVVEKIQQTSDLGATCQDNSKLSKRTAKKQLNPWHSAVLDKRESSILDESCTVADNFPHQWKKVTYVEDVEKMQTSGWSCKDSLNLNKVSTQNQLPFYHGSGQNISDPLLPDEDYDCFLNQIRSDRRNTRIFTSKRKEPSDLVKKDQIMSSVEMNQQENSIWNADTAKMQVHVRPLANNEAELMDDRCASFVGHIRDHKNSHKTRYRSLENGKPYAWKYEKDNLISSDCMCKEGLIFSDNKQQLDTSQCSAQNGVQCSLVDPDYEEFLKRLHIHGSSCMHTFKNQWDEGMAGFIYDEYNIFLPRDHNKKMKQEDGRSLGNGEQSLTDNEFVAHTFCVSKESKPSLIGEKDIHFKTPAGIKAEKDVRKDKDYEHFLRHLRKHRCSYVLEVTDTEQRNIVVYKYEKYEDKGQWLQNIGSRKLTVVLRDVKRARSDPSYDLSTEGKHLDYPLKIRRSPRLMQLTERKSPRLSDGILLENSSQHMVSGLGPCDNEAPGSFNYSFGCGRLDSFSESLHALLRKPYDRKEHKELIEEANLHKPITRERNLRGHSKTYFTQKLGLSYMDHYPDLHERIRAADDGQQLKLLRGFFFWLQNSCREDSFMPWLSSTSERDVVHIVDE
ncbi:uncharacterized protein LOC116258538 isoform X2 [Nymphaea colorata]|uniref:uncharacterized protein LOC116258538 isoform X2 n=1 Tax=Nymphaea colorata TaxID=210225 RepID=UPI00129E6F33|nr:uncharacterized protein LOC116258538 isoform X2 [Nymphaea colorata]